MKDFFVLKLFDKISFIFKAIGINYMLMRKILQLKLVLDQRRVPTIMANSKMTEERSSYKTALFIYAFLGLFLCVPIFFPFPMFLKMNIVFGLIIFMLMTTMVSDFSSVLLDLNDRKILLPRPVDIKSMNAAKIIHISIYLFNITMAIAGFSLIAGLIKYGFLFFLVFLFEIILICGFVILLTSLLYFLILTFFNSEKLKDIINYFQILLTIFMTVMYQFMGRIFNLANMNISFKPQMWHFFLPSSWFAAPFNLLMEHDLNQYYVFLSVIGVIIPIITMTIYIKVVAPYFEKNLQKLNDYSSSKKRLNKINIPRFLSEMICYKKQEKVFFRFTQLMLSNERKLKLKLYPNLAFSVIMPFIFLISLISRHTSIYDTFTTISKTKYYLIIYLSIIFLSSSITMLSGSEKFKGAWIYKALPVDNPAILLKGALKGFICKFILPIYLVISIIFIFIFGIKIFADLILMFINLLLLVLFIFKFSRKELPFYKDFQYTQNGNNIGVIFVSFAIAGLFAGIQYVLPTFISYGVMANIIISLILLLIMWHYSFKIEWKDIENDAQ